MPNSAANDADTTNATSMSRLDVIRLVGDVLTQLDVLRANYDRSTQTRTELDNLRDDIDNVERKLVRIVIQENSKEFRERSAALKEVNEDVRQTIERVDRVAETLKTLVKFLEAAQKIAELLPF